MPVGVTIVSSPNTCLQVPAISSKDSESPDVMGAGSNPLPDLESVMWKGEDLGESSNADTEKLSDLMTGVRTERMCSRVSLAEEVLHSIS